MSSKVLELNEEVLPLKGTSILEKKKQLEGRYDHIRKMLMSEPRGHENMFGALLVDPVHPEADFGVIFMDHGNYLNMCVHGSIGVVSAAIKLGWIQKERVKLDTPAGLIDCKIVYAKGGELESVKLTNVPSFFVEEGSVQVEHFTIPYRIAFGGSFFALVNVTSINIELEKRNLRRLSDIGVKIRSAINARELVQHPILPIRGVDLVEFYDLNRHVNVVVFGDGQIDRSPCGTGTCAQLANLHSLGLIKQNEPFAHKSVLGTEFVGKIVQVDSLGPYQSVIPEIEGKAWVTGMGQLMLEDDDPFQEGFAI